jgi:hypothetical protein
MFLLADQRGVRSFPFVMGKMTKKNSVLVMSGAAEN